jgi:large subunit ribosomal protein L4
MPRKMFRAALRSALAVKLRDNQLNVVDAFTLDSHKTKPFVEALSGMGFTRKVLVIDHEENPNLSLASRNLSEVRLMRSLQLTPYQLLNAGPVVFSKASIQALEEVLKK